jgi:hypothetical protein
MPLGAFVGARCQLTTVPSVPAPAWSELDTRVCTTPVLTLVETDSKKVGADLQ